MICPACKSSIRDGSVFCPVCGKPVPQDGPDIHRIETVELPKREAEPAAAVRNNTDPGRPDVHTVHTVESDAALQMPPNEKNTERAGAEMSFRGSRPSTNASMPERKGYPDPSGRGPSRQYQNDPPRNQGSRGPVSRPAGMNGMPGRHFPDYEQFQIRHSISVRSMLAFIFSIFGLCSLALDLPCAIVGLILSIIVRNEYRDRGWQKDTDLKLANAAFICSIIGIVLGVISLIVIMVTGAGIIAGLSALGAMMSGGNNYYGF